MCVRIELTKKGFADPRIKPLCQHIQKKNKMELNI